MIRLERAKPVGGVEMNHRMLTFGNADTTALRMTMGRISRRGYWHKWQPDVFLIRHGRRR